MVSWVGRGGSPSPGGPSCQGLEGRERRRGSGGAAGSFPAPPAPCWPRSESEASGGLARRSSRVMVWRAPRGCQELGALPRGRRPSRGGDLMATRAPHPRAHFQLPGAAPKKIIQTEKERGVQILSQRHREMVPKKILVHQHNGIFFFFLFLQAFIRCSLCEERPDSY